MLIVQNQTSLFIRLNLVHENKIDILDPYLIVCRTEEENTFCSAGLLSSFLLCLDLGVLGTFPVSSLGTTQPLPPGAPKP